MNRNLEKYLALVDDTLAFYYKDGKPIEGRRSIEPDEEEEGGFRCVYAGPEGQRCAASRLLPDASWIPGTCLMPDNRPLCAEAMRKAGINLVDEECTAVELVRKLQCIHDYVEDPELYAKQAREYAHSLNWSEEEL